MNAVPAPCPAHLRFKHVAALGEAELQGTGVLCDTHKRPISPAEMREAKQPEAKQLSEGRARW